MFEKPTLCGARRWLSGQKATEPNRPRRSIAPAPMGRRLLAQPATCAGATNLLDHAHPTLILERRSSMTIDQHKSNESRQSNVQGRAGLLRRQRDVFATMAVAGLVCLSWAGVATGQENYEGAEPQAYNASPTCLEAGMNVQCTEFGSIKMDSRRDVRGDPIDLTAYIQLNTAYGDRGARWIMFSMRNATEDGPSPVTIGLTSFSTSSGDIVTTRVEQVKPSELNLWVDVLDLPVASPISLQMKVGSTQRGAFALETLVLAFDRGYAPIQDAQGNDSSLFSFTLLGVNKETGSTAGDGGSFTDGKKLPGLESIAALTVLALGAAWMLRRRTA